MDIHVKSHHPDTVKIIFKLRRTPFNPLNLRYLKHFPIRKITYTHLAVPLKHLWMYLRAYDILLEKMYEVKEEDRRREGSSTDIDSIQEAKKLNKEIAEVLILL